MADDPMDGLLGEITAMQGAEERIEYSSAVQQIINMHSSLVDFIGHLPTQFDVYQDKKENYLMEEFYLLPSGFRFKDFTVEIKEGKYLVIKDKESKVIFKFLENNIFGAKSVVVEIATGIKLLGSLFQKQTKEKIAEEEKKLIQKLKDF